MISGRHIGVPLSLRRKVISIILISKNGNKGNKISEQLWCWMYQALGFACQRPISTKNCLSTAQVSTAGLTETCLHVASVLFYLEPRTNINYRLSCISRWNTKRQSSVKFPIFWSFCANSQRSKGFLSMIRELNKYWDSSICVQTSTVIFSSLSFPERYKIWNLLTWLIQFLSLCYSL